MTDNVSGNVEVGYRVELVHTDDQFTSVEPGDAGTVTAIDTVPPEVTPSGRVERQIRVSFDQGVTLGLIPESGDRFEVITDE